jgi:hypothetical protein
MTEKESECEESLRDILHRDREAHERLLQRTGKDKPSDTKPTVNSGDGATPPRNSADSDGAGNPVGSELLM